MRILIDADVLLDAALDRAPHAEHASRILRAVQSGELIAFVAWHTISNVYYMLGQAAGRGRVHDFIRDLARLVDVAPVDKDSIGIALSLDMRDFEDAMQVACALTAKVDAIVTRNVSDFRNSPVSVMRSADFSL